MPHSDSEVERARQTIRDAAATGNQTAREMLRGVERDERRERAEGESSVQRP